jgi:Fic family protein
MEKKITKVDRFNQLMALDEVKANADLMAFCEHEIELLQKKSSSKKPTKAQEENEVLKNKIVEVLGSFENGATASEVLGADTTFAGMSNQKISALLKQLVDSGVVVKSTDKKKSIFSVA